MEQVIETSAMTHIMMILAWLGIYGSMAIGGIGSMIGCSIAGKSAAGALLEVESGYAKFVGVAAMPASQIIYGFIVMLQLLEIERTLDNASAIAVIGITAGIALLFNAVLQGRVIASAIKVTKAKPDVFTFSVIPAAVVEGFAVFVLIFALIVMGNI